MYITNQRSEHVERCVCAERRESSGQRRVSLVAFDRDASLIKHGADVEARRIKRNDRDARFGVVVQQRVIDWRSAAISKIVKVVILVRHND